MPTTARPSKTAESRSTSLALIRVLVDGLGRSARSIEQHSGITNAQLFLLQQLQETDGLSVNDLAERARTSQSTASIVISRLVRAKLVRKTRSKADSRRAVLTLTNAARLLLRDAPEPPLAQLLEALNRMRVSDTHALASGLRALVDELGLANVQPAMLFEHSPRKSRVADQVK